MKTERPHERETQETASVERGASAELVAAVTVLVFVVITAGSVILATPQSFQSLETSQRIIESAIPKEAPERPYHERHPIQPGGAQIDAPTF